MPGYSPFEGRLVKLLNDYFEHTKQPGFAFRLKTSRFATQFIDVLVDSASKEHYLAVECKSINPSKTPKFYFSSWTTSRNGEHQVEQITRFIEKTQRFGILAVEIRHGSGPKPNEIYLIPWHHVRHAFENGKKAIDPKDLQNYPRLKREDGVLNFVACLHKLRQY